MMGLMPNDSHLADAIQRRARELGLDQEGLIASSGMGRTTVQRLWTGKLDNEPSRRTKTDMERVLRWEPGGFDIAREGGEPTVRREPVLDAETDVKSSVAAAARPTTIPEMPLRVQLALEGGRPLDYDVLEFEVGGRPLSIVAWAQSGVYDTEEDRAALLEQLKAFKRMMDALRREGDAADDAPAPENG